MPPLFLYTLYCAQASFRLRSPCLSMADGLRFPTANGAAVSVNLKLIHHVVVDDLPFILGTSVIMVRFKIPDIAVGRAWQAVTPHCGDIFLPINPFMAFYSHKKQFIMIKPLREIKEEKAA